MVAKYTRISPTSENESYLFLHFKYAFKVTFLHTTGTFKAFAIVADIYLGPRKGAEYEYDGGD